MRFQKHLIEQLLRGETIPAEASHLIRGRARWYLSRYQRSLEQAVEKAAACSNRQAMYTPGPRGGRWLGFWRLA